MSVIYLQSKIAERKRDLPPMGAGMCRNGYTRRSGAPTDIMIRLEGEKIWRRVMVWQFSNSGTCFVRIKGVPHILSNFEVWS